MKVTSLSAQIRNPDRVNISIDGKYRFSLDISQVVDLEVRVGRELDETELAVLKVESQFGRLYAQTLEYSLRRPHSVREIRDYLYRKTHTSMYKNKNGEVKERLGISPALAERVIQKLQHKHYIDDEVFTRWWVDNRNLTKGTSLRKITAELRAKGVDLDIIEGVLRESSRNDADEIAKIIAKKRHKYSDDKKLTMYLVRQGFRYDDVISVLQSIE
jgi:regulatory protein